MLRNRIRPLNTVALDRLHAELLDARALHRTLVPAPNERVPGRRGHQTGAVRGVAEENVVAGDEGGVVRCAFDVGRRHRAGDQELIYVEVGRHHVRGDRLRGGIFELIADVRIAAECEVHRVGHDHRVRGLGRAPLDDRFPCIDVGTRGTV